VSFAQRGADFLENLNPFAEVERRREQRKQEREREERERQERERRARDDYDRQRKQEDINRDVERARIMAGQTFQFGQQGADGELGRALTLRNSDMTNAMKVIGAATQGKVDAIGAGYQGQNSVIKNLLRGQKESQTSKQDWVKGILDGYQAHERGVLGDLIGPTPALEQFNRTYLTALDRTIAADERLQAAERPLRWAGLVLPTTAALAAALIA
jgi:hypothetical protein